MVRQSFKVYCIWICKSSAENKSNIKRKTVILTLGTILDPYLVVYCKMFRRKLKGAVLAAVSSPKWTMFDTEPIRWGHLKLSIRKWVPMRTFHKFTWSKNFTMSQWERQLPIRFKISWEPPTRSWGHANLWQGYDVISYKPLTRSKCRSKPKKTKSTSKARSLWLEVMTMRSETIFMHAGMTRVFLLAQGKRSSAND